MLRMMEPGSAPSLTRTRNVITHEARLTGWCGARDVEASDQRRGAVDVARVRITGHRAPGVVGRPRRDHVDDRHIARWRRAVVGDRKLILDQISRPASVRDTALRAEALFRLVRPRLSSVPSSRAAPSRRCR